jgi:hypothetical protein
VLLGAALPEDTCMRVGYSKRGLTLLDHFIHSVEILVQYLVHSEHVDAILFENGT